MPRSTDSACNLCRQDCPKNHLGEYIEDGATWQVPIILNKTYAVMATVNFEDKNSLMQG